MSKEGREWRYPILMDDGVTAMTKVLPDGRFLW